MVQVVRKTFGLKGRFSKSLTSGKGHQGHQDEDLLLHGQTPNLGSLTSKNHFSKPQISRAKNGKIFSQNGPSIAEMVAKKEHAKSAAKKSRGALVSDAKFCGNFFENHVAVHSLRALETQLKSQPVFLRCTRAIFPLFSLYLESLFLAARALGLNRLRSLSGCACQTSFLQEVTKKEEDASSSSTV